MAPQRLFTPSYHVEIHWRQLKSVWLKTESKNIFSRVMFSSENGWQSKIKEKYHSLRIDATLDIQRLVFHVIASKSPCTCSDGISAVSRVAGAHFKHQLCGSKVTGEGRQSMQSWKKQIEREPSCSLSSARNITQL